MPDTQTHFEAEGFPPGTPDSPSHGHSGAGAPRPPHVPDPAPALDPDSAPGLSLKISTVKTGAPLSKAQKTYNRLISQIEGLRRETAETIRRLDKALQYQAQKLHPIHRQIAARLAEIILFAHPHLKPAHGGLSDKQRRTLRAFISSQLGTILAIEGALPNEKLQAIHIEIEGMTPGEARRRALDAEHADIEAGLKDLGVDIDLSAFNKDNATPDELFRATAAILEQLKKVGLSERDLPPELRHFFTNAAPDSGTAAAGTAADPADPAAKPRKKTKKQIERESREKAMEEARARSLSSIYKQLARAFHPDLEQDPARKKQKELLMQQLTVAYRANDMHTLLRLELEWLQRGEPGAERLGGEKLAIYNEVLREQVAALKDERDMLQEHPRYEPLRAYAGMFGDITLFDGPAEERKLKNGLDYLQTLNTAATGPEAVKLLREILRDFAQEVEDRARAQTMREIMDGSFDEIMSEMMSANPGRRPPRR